MNHLFFTSLFFYFSFLAPCFAQFATLGPGSCGTGQNNCHVAEGNWLSGDKHYVTNERFYNSNKAVDIAKAYGLAPKDSKRSDSVCMTCHATVISADLKKSPIPEPESGVSCENCHGPGSGYKENHSSSEVKGQGRGYEIGVRFGMRKNKDMPVRATMCVTCHLVKNAKLLAAGHPDGKNFNYKNGIQQVAKHFRPPGINEPERMAFVTAVENAKRATGTVLAMAASSTPPKVLPKKFEPQPAPKKEPLPKIEVDSDTAVTIDIIATELPVPQASRVITPEPQFLLPPMPMMPRTKPSKPLILPSYPNFNGAKTKADSLAILVKHLNALLQATRMP